MGPAATYYEGTRLLENEEVYRHVSPHPFGMYRLYIIWLYFLALAGLIVEYRREGMDMLTPYFPEVAVDTLYMGTWAAMLLVSGLLLAVLRISIRWLLFVFAVTALSWYLKTQTEASAYVVHPEDWVLMGVSLAGILFTDYHRRCHSYLVTNQRVVIRSGGLFGSSERSLFYSRIDDVIVAQSITGRIFSFGTIVPLSSSGIGTGSAHAGATVQTGARILGANLGVGVVGLKGKKIPDESLEYTLYNVPDPTGVAHVILQEIATRG